MTDRYVYSAFGELLEHSGADLNPYHFAGEPFDPNSGFYYNRARWMDPASGRFVSADPFPGATSEPVSLHKYLYASNDPANTTDPTGLFSLPQVGTALAVVGTTYSVIAPTYQAALDLQSGVSLGQVSVRLAQDAAVGILASLFVGGLFRFAPRILKIRPSGWRIPATGRSSKSMWNKGIAPRGEAAENAILGSLGRNRILPWNYPVIDDFTDNVAMSIKSLDLIPASDKYIRRQIENAAEKLDGFVPRNWGNAKLANEHVRDRVLVYAFERGAADRAQSRLLQEIADEVSQQYPSVRLFYQWIE